jgi:hypothetical protein
MMKCESNRTKSVYTSGIEIESLVVKTRMVPQGTSNITSQPSTHVNSSFKRTSSSGSSSFAFNSSSLLTYVGILARKFNNSKYYSYFKFFNKRENISRLVDFSEFKFHLHTIVVSIVSALVYMYHH